MNRNRQLAKIHIAAKQLGLDRDAYEDVLWAVCRVRSAKDLDEHGRKELLKHFGGLGWKPKRGKPHPGQPHNLFCDDRGRQLRKIEAVLAEANRPWKYADAIARRMFKVDRVAFCRPDQLQKVIAALEYDERRRHKDR